MAKISDISHTFENGITVVNTTPHPLNFQDSVTGETVTIPTSVPEGERTGDYVVNAQSNEVDLGGGLVTTEFVPSEEGQARIDEIKDWAQDESKDVRIVGSMIAAQAFGGEVVGMVAAPGFERVPPQNKLMSVEKFTAFPAKENNDVTNDKIAELEKKIEALEAKNEELETKNFKHELIGKIEDRIDYNEKMAEMTGDESINAKTEELYDTIDAIKDEDVSLETLKEIDEAIGDEFINDDKIELVNGIIKEDDILVVGEEKDSETEIESPELKDDTVGDSSEDMESKTETNIDSDKDNTDNEDVTKIDNDDDDPPC